MAWTVEFDRAACRDLEDLDPQIARRILTFIATRLAVSEDPRRLGEALTGSRLGNFWKYRVGDYRIIADLQDGVARILVLRVGNRREIYRK